MLPSVLLAIGTVSALSVPKTRRDASCTISSLDDVDSVVSSCTDITINSFTVDADTTLDLSGLADGSKVTLGACFFRFSGQSMLLMRTTAGNLTWAKSTDFEGPLFQIGGSGVSFDGAGVCSSNRLPAHYASRLTALCRVHIRWPRCPILGWSRLKWRCHQAQVHQGDDGRRVQGFERPERACSLLLYR